MEYLYADAVIKLTNLDHEIQVMALDLDDKTRFVC